MKVLGVSHSASEVQWAVVRNSIENPEYVEISDFRHKIPKDKEDVAILDDLYKYFKLLIDEYEVDRVSTIQSIVNPMGKTSTIRIKIEGVLQLACFNGGIDLCIKHPSAFRSRVKKFCDLVGEEPEVVFNNGEDFKPKTRKDTVLTAWLGLWNE